MMGALVDTLVLPPLSSLLASSFLSSSFESTDQFLLHISCCSYAYPTSYDVLSVLSQGPQLYAKFGNKISPCSSMGRVAEGYFTNVTFQESIPIILSTHIPDS